MKLEKMTPGMVLHSYGRDGSIMRRKCSWTVRIVEVDLERGMVLASWNDNPPQWRTARQAEKWRKLSYSDAQKAKAAKEKKP